MPKNEEGIMNMAEMSFTIMKYLGIYRPTSWTSKCAIQLYHIYNCLILTFLYCFAMTFLVSLIQNFDDVDLFTENMFFFSGLFVLSFKSTYFSIYHENLVNFKNMFLQNQCKPRDSREMLIKKKFHEIDRSNSRLFLLITLTTTTIHTVGPLTKGKDVTLPFNNWVPYDIESRSVFWLVYIYQSISIFISVSINAAIEILGSVMMQQISAQLEIIMYRLHRLLELPKLSKKGDSGVDTHQRELYIVKDFITHHTYIFAIHTKLKDLLGLILFVQFFVATIGLCTIGYQFSKMSVTSAKFWSEAGILSSALFQILLYCWYGNEMIEKSLAIVDAVYGMNWTFLTESTKRNLIIIIIRASRPIALSGGSIIPMSIDTFVKVLKTSYSAFNLLRTI